MNHPAVTFRQIAHQDMPGVYGWAAAALDSMLKLSRWQDATVVEEGEDE